MTTLTGTLYDAGLTTGTDEGTVIYPVRLKTAQEFRNFFSLWVLLSPWRPSSMLDAQQQARELQRWTEWSDRTLAQVLGTTHPTVRALLEGRGATSSRTTTVRARLRNVHEMVARVHALSGGSSIVTARTLAELPPGSSERPLDYLQAGEIAHAYLAALDILRPAPRGVEGLLSADWPVRAGEASAELHIEE
jgi:hypothetical protein